jgi:hypothetical protein
MSCSDARAPVARRRAPCCPSADARQSASASSRPARDAAPPLTAIPLYSRLLTDPDGPGRSPRVAPRFDGEQATVRRAAALAHRGAGRDRA